MGRRRAAREVRELGSAIVDRDAAARLQLSYGIVEKRTTGASATRQSCIKASRDRGDVLVVRDWRTGAVASSADLQDDIDSIALRPDGRVAATTLYDRVLYELRPGSPPRPLARHAGSVAYAGDSLVYRSDDGSLRVIEPSGRIRRFGVPTASLGGFAIDGSRVVWVANGCLLVDDVSAPLAAAPGPGPCPRSELALVQSASPHLARTFPVVLRCVTAPRACRGVLRLDTADDETLAHTRAITGPVRFSIPAGHVRRFRVRLTGRGYRIMRRSVARANADKGEFPRNAIVIVDARTDESRRFPDAERARGVLELARDEPRIEPPKGLSPAVRGVYVDYLGDGTIDVCGHTARALEQTLATIDPKFDKDNPDFRPAIKAGIDRHARHLCRTIRP